jgi:hypothetical protein
MELESCRRIGCIADPVPARPGTGFSGRLKRRPHRAPDPLGLLEGSRVGESVFGPADQRSRRASTLVRFSEAGLTGKALAYVRNPRAALRQPWRHSASKSRATHATPRRPLSASCLGQDGEPLFGGEAFAGEVVGSWASSARCSGTRPSTGLHRRSLRHDLPPRLPPAAETHPCKRVGSPPPPPSVGATHVPDGSVPHATGCIFQVAAAIDGAPGDR